MWSMLIVIPFFCALALANHVVPLLFDFRFGRDGIDVVGIVGTVRLWHIDRRNIRGARVAGRWGDLHRMQFALRISNRMTKRCLLVELRRFPWLVLLTPKDPEAAKQALGI